MSEYVNDDIAWSVFSEEMRKVAKQSIKDALADLDLEAVLDSSLPGLTGDAREALLESGRYMQSKGAEYVNIAHPAERHWEEQMSQDAMEMRFS